MRPTKEINCTLSIEQLRELGEPAARFTFTMPKEIKTASKCAYKKDDLRPAVVDILLEPASGKIVVTNTYVLTTLDIVCDGVWPASEEDKHFQCKIDPKTAAALAGKEVDAVAWVDDKGIAEVTLCEGERVIGQNVNKYRYPDWTRVVYGMNPAASLTLAADAIKPLCDLLKANMGTNKHDKENRRAIIQAEAGGAYLDVRIKDTYAEEDEVLAQVQFPLAQSPDKELKIAFNAEMLYLCCESGFNGEISFIEPTRPAIFHGEVRQSLLMPNKLD